MTREGTALSPVDDEPSVVSPVLSAVPVVDVEASPVVVPGSPVEVFDVSPGAVVPVPGEVVDDGSDVDELESLSVSAGAVSSPHAATRRVRASVQRGEGMLSTLRRKALTSAFSGLKPLTTLRRATPCRRGATGGSL
jgi:hypothetical protein